MPQARLKLSPELREGNKSFWLSITFYIEPRPRKKNTINFEIDEWRNERIVNKANIKVDLIEGKKLLKDLIEKEKDIKLSDLNLIVKQGDASQEKVIEINIKNLMFAYSWDKFVVWASEILNFLEISLQEYYKDLYYLVKEGSDYETKIKEIEQSLSSADRAGD